VPSRRTTATVVWAWLAVMLIASVVAAMASAWPIAGAAPRRQVHRIAPSTSRNFGSWTFRDANAECTSWTCRPVMALVDEEELGEAVRAHPVSACVRAVRCQDSSSAQLGTSERPRPRHCREPCPRMRTRAWDDRRPVILSLRRSEERRSEDRREPTPPVGNPAILGVVGVGWSAGPAPDVAAGKSAPPGRPFGPAPRCVR
jgi:hypothetical protein